MIEQVATVLAVEQGGVWLGTTPVTTCNSCQVSTDCGTGIVAKTLTPRQTRFFVQTPLTLLPGEQVTVASDEQQVIQAALLVYLLPLAMLILFALFAQLVLNAAEGWVILAAAAGVTLGFLVARFVGVRVARVQQLSIVNVLPAINVRQV